MEDLKNAWLVYLRCDGKLQNKQVLTIQEGQVALVAVAPPNKKAMHSMLVTKMGLPMEQVDLMESEMVRLRWWYGAKTLDWVIFVIAAYNLFYPHAYPDASASDSQWRPYCAKLRKGFTKWDLDCDEFLDKEEFIALCKDDLLRSDASEEEVAISLKEIFLQLRSLGVNCDERLSLAEYTLWRWMREFGHL